MRRTSFAVAACAALALALAPGLAEARAGGGSSFGSRGGMTWSAPPSTGTAPYSAAPMQRGMTPNSPSPGYGSGFAAPNSGFGARSGFMSGLMGGLIGAGIGGLLLGHGFFGGMLGFGGFLGFLLQIFLIVLVVRFLIRLFRGQSPAFAGGPNIFARGGPPSPGPTGGFGGPAGPPPIQIGPQDYQAFEQLLQGIQAAWSRQDLNALRALVTPEMLSYFAEQLAEQASQGARNEVTDVRLLQGDLAQAWSEGNREYATVAMRFSMIDVTRDASGRIVDGSPSEHVTATELWTFVRAPGGRWILSAIQQAR
ncbi:MAG TPA: TIM44-like domain-containing protein [Acetobacteraceae bacterium]|nr:TIM44-like domain-containing protein [Acetobacteraceae bacterium]